MTLALNTQPQQLSFAQIEAVWIQAGGDPSKAALMAAVAKAESGGWTSGPNATNYNTGGSAPGSTDIGLWQINNFYHPQQATYDVLQNAKGAIIISNNGQNLHPWCTAWSNNFCGGTFWGQGSHARAIYEANAGIAPASGGIQLTSLQQPNNAAGGGNSPANQAGTSDTCAWQVDFPLFGSSCIVSKVVLRQIVGGLMIGTGALIGMFGVIVIAVYTYNKTVGGPLGQSASAIAKVF